MRASAGALPCGSPVPETRIGMWEGTPLSGPHRFVGNGNLRTVVGTENLSVGCGLCCPLSPCDPVPRPRAESRLCDRVRCTDCKPCTGIGYHAMGIILSGIISFFNIDLVSCFPERSPRIARKPVRNSL